MPFRRRQNFHTVIPFRHTPDFLYRSMPFRNPIKIRHRYTLHRRFATTETFKNVFVRSFRQVDAGHETVITITVTTLIHLTRYWIKQMIYVRRNHVAVGNEHEEIGTITERSGNNTYGKCGGKPLTEENLPFVSLHLKTPEVSRP